MTESDGAGRIIGRVVDKEDEQPLFGVKVTAYCQTTIPFNNAMTDLKGSFEIDQVPAETYLVEARAIGYKPATQSCLVQSEKIQIVNFALEVDPTDE